MMEAGFQSDGWREQNGGTKYQTLEKGFQGFGSKKNKELYLAMKNKEFWKTVIQVIVTVLTALTTTLGVTSCK
jgi:hypothetical protein